MRRLLVITGILFFAVLIVDTASRLQDEFEAGTLFERYNSQRKADITLFTISVCGIAPSVANRTEAGGQAGGRPKRHL